MNIEQTRIEKIGNSEQIIAPEIPRESWETLVILQRHGRYDSNRPKDWTNIAPNEMSFGHLTDEGRAEAAKITEQRLDVIFENDRHNTDFLILNSPTFWLDNERLGQRAKETAEIIHGVLDEKIKSNIISEEQLLNHSGRFRGGEESSRPDKRLGEALFFQAPEFANFLRKEYGGQGPKFWEAFNRDTHQEMREELRAEGPEDIADRIQEVVDIIGRFSSFYHKNHPGRKLVVWMVTHGDGLDPYVQRKVGAPESDFSATYNAGIGISISHDSEANVEIKGKKYKISLPKHGKSHH